MRSWLFKSEPSEWGWEDQVAKGEEGEEWAGVRNYQARNFMREMALGDRGFFYHSPYYTTLLILVGISNQGETAAIGSDLSSFRI